MKIAAASLAFSARHSATASHELRETLRTWVGASRPDAAGNPGVPALPASAISMAAYSAQAQSQFRTQTVIDAIDQTDSDPVLQLIKTMLELLTGHIIQVFSGAEMRTRPAPAPADPNAAQPRGEGRGSAGFGSEYRRREIRSETEQSDFQATGRIRTADGRDIQFELGLSMQRSFREETDISRVAGDARQKDPLVINFGGTAAQLQNRRFLFDITGDGQMENMPLLGGGSGFLALDLNGNGRIDTGRELLGTASGNGFADLAGHDGDGNGWIDENDPVFGKLRVWTPDGTGAGALSSLQQKNVGALFLGSQATPFELRDGDNRSLGSIRASGVYLAENGTAGTLQQIDLSV